jgi:hypothetical protein
MPRLLLALSAAALLLNGCATQGKPAPPPAATPAALAISPFASQEAADAWFQGYYLAPDPDRLEEYVRFVDDGGLMSRTGTKVVVSAFLGEVFRQNPDRVAAWSYALAETGDDCRKVVITGLWYAQVDDLETRIREVARIDGPEPIIARLLREPPPDITQVPISDASVLDHFWGRFMATGDALYVRRVIEALPPTGDDGEAASDAISGSARWSLMTLAMRHDRVLEICREERLTQPAEIAATLDTIITTAEQGRAGG